MQAIQTLYQQYASDVFRFAYGLCGDKHLANDLVAETFVRAMLSSKPIELDTVRAYLCMIARRLFERVASPSSTYGINGCAL